MPIGLAGAAILTMTMEWIRKSSKPGSASYDYRVTGLSDDAGDFRHPGIAEVNTHNLKICCAIRDTRCALVLPDATAPGTAPRLRHADQDADAA
jgi:hypothetical protein